jgi:hypothetical protein
LNDTLQTLSNKLSTPDQSSVIPSLDLQNSPSDNTPVAPVSNVDATKAVDVHKTPLNTTTKPTAETKGNKVSESKVYQPLETANFAFSRRVNFQDRVKKLLSDFGMTDDDSDDSSA